MKAQRRKMQTRAEKKTRPPDAPYMEQDTFTVEGVPVTSPMRVGVNGPENGKVKTKKKG